MHFQILIVLLPGNHLPPFLFSSNFLPNLGDFFANKMASTIISVNLPPDIDPTKARLAYGDRALPKLVSFDVK